MEHLQQAYGHKARFMTEVASMLLSSGYPQPGRDLNFSPEWLDYINRVILPTQLHMENGHIHAAETNRFSTVFYDRGLLDPAAYLPEGKLTLQDQYGLNISDIQDRYTMVIHLQSLACVDAELYNKLQGTNASRYDSAETAIQRDEALVEAWKDHPNWQFISAEGGMDSVLQRVWNLIVPLLNVEIERKWRIDCQFPFEEGLPNERIEQFYAENGLRFRQKGDKYFITSKSGSGTSRFEWEVSIPEQVFLNHISEEQPYIAKTRYYKSHGDHTLEIDVYDNPKGLITVECEFMSELEAEQYELPEWLQPYAVDVTHDPNYTNAAMARQILEGGKN
jgi:CYTH domain-containing protein